MSATSVVFAPVCGDDGFCGEPGGVECAPYQCDNGSCLTTCDWDHTCVAPSTCNNNNNKCVNSILGSACSDDSECASGHCADGVCCNEDCSGAAKSCLNKRTKLPDGTCGPAVLGVSCTKGIECASGFCADGVCCSSSCANPCEGCSAQVKGGGVDGICAPVAAQTDPHDRCDISGWGICAVPGVCDGKGACAYHKEKPCGDDAHCQSDSKAIGQQTCNPKGYCGEGKVTNCGNYKCSNNVCPTTCTSSAQCLDDTFKCLDGQCVKPSIVGDTCKDSKQCKGGHCVEGVCCDTVCDGACMSCLGNLTGKGDGVCANVLAGHKDPKNTCQVSNPPCGADGTCDGQGKCRVFAPKDTSCGQSCSGDAVLLSECSGDGKCLPDPKTASTCFPYACSSSLNACLSLCSSNDECATGAKCHHEDGKCAPTQDTCKDEFSLVTTDGKDTDCRPYRCKAGKCRSSCNVEGDCSDGYACQGGKCLKKQDAGAGHDAAPSVDAGESGAAAPPDDTGCGCRTAGSSGSSGRGSAGFAGLLLLLAGLAFRRRSRRPWSQARPSVG